MHQGLKRVKGQVVVRLNDRDTLPSLEVLEKQRLEQPALT